MPHFLNRYGELPQHFYHRQNPEALTEARLVHRNTELENALGTAFSEEDLLGVLSGARPLPECQPLAQKYTGHQFGYYNPDLGDGRGLLIGQSRDDNGALWDWHLKGSGTTPFSRRGDGRAVLRSAIREHLGSEAMHALGIPTTRSLGLCHSEEAVRRETMEPRAAYIRIAKTHVRFGHFEWLAQQQDSSGFRQLADYVIETVYPELKAQPDRYNALLHTISARTAEVIAGWQAAGFCHGVMNSDNMSVAGETFDYGPYAFMDDFKIHFICNHSDTEGRYAYSQQPNIGLWNCQVLAGAFSLLLNESELESALNHYVETYNQAYLDKMRNKIGLKDSHPEDRDLVHDLLVLMDRSELDFHHFFLNLADHHAMDTCLNAGFLPASKAWKSWLTRYFQRRGLESDVSQIETTLRQNTPLFVLRNYINQEVIDAAYEGDFTLLHLCFEALKSPFEKHPGLPERYYQPPESPQQKGLALSCSS